MRKDISLHNKRKALTYSLLFGTFLGLFFSFSAFSQKGELNKNSYHSTQSNEGANDVLEKINHDVLKTHELNLQQREESPFDAVKGLKEDLSKRDAYSKHYINEDGSFTALIGAGPIHYEYNGQFIDINHKITQSNVVNYSFANTSNLMESFFGNSTEFGVKSKTTEGEVLEFINPNMYWEVNGQIVGNIQAANNQVLVQEDKAIYPNIYGNISAEYKVLTGKREMNYIIPNEQALGTVPAGADYLVFTEDIILPFGWTSNVTENGILIKNQIGKEIYLYENPHSTDAESQGLREENTIFETSHSGNTLTIKTKVKTDWLLNSERVYPVMVDPTVSYYPSYNPDTHSTGQANSGDGGTYGDIAVGRNGNILYRGWASFKTNSLPAGAIINSLKLSVRVGTISGSLADKGAMLRSFTTNPDYDYLYYSDIYNAIENFDSYNVSIVGLTSTGWVDRTLPNAAISDFQSGLANNRFSIGFGRTGSWAVGQYMVINGYQSAYPPYITIDYTLPNVPPTCATTPSPSNGFTSAPHQGNLRWNPVAGATSYDVYFGTDNNPPLVSANQTNTSYTITDCLLPETTYYWKVVPKNAYGSATGCTTWSFTTDSKINVYENNWDIENIGVFNIAGGVDTDGWLTNNYYGNSGPYYIDGLNNTWTIGDGPHAISGKSVGVSGLNNGGLAGDFFQYWSDIGEIHRWISRPFDMRGLRDIEVNFKWKAGGEENHDYGSVISSINGGLNWMMDEQGGLNNDGKYWNSPTTVRTESIIFPDSRNNQQDFVLGFKWDDFSGNGIGTAPTFVVDDIIVKACPYEGEIYSDKVANGIFKWMPVGNTQTTLTVAGSHACAQFEWEQSTDNGISWTVIPNVSTGSYTTPSDLDGETWYRTRVYFGSGCSGVYQNEAFKIIPEEPLPVELTHFSTTCEESEASIRWETATETNSAYFVVEKSRDGETWTVVKQVTAAGNSSAVRTYKVVDSERIHGVFYYRLVQVDFDGQKEIFGAFTATCNEYTSEWSVYPNPNLGDFNIEINSSEKIEGAVLQLVDLMGKVVFEKTLDISPETSLVSIKQKEQLSPSSYVLRLKNESHYFKPIKIIVK